MDILSLSSGPNMRRFLFYAGDMHIKDRGGLAPFIDFFALSVDRLDTPR